MIDQKLENNFNFSINRRFFKLLKFSKQPDQIIMVDSTWMEIIHHKKSITKTWSIAQNNWMESKLKFTTNTLEQCKLGRCSFIFDELLTCTSLNRRRSV